MLRCEETWEDDEAIDDELTASNPLIIQRNQVSTTIMFEYPTKEERESELPKLFLPTSCLPSSMNTVRLKGRRAACRRGPDWGCPLPRSSQSCWAGPSARRAKVGKGSTFTVRVPTTYQPSKA